MQTTRRAARLSGDKFYYTSRPCVRGHVAKRYTVSGRCTVCHLEAQLRWDRKHREQRNALRRKQYKDPEVAARRRKQGRDWYDRQRTQERIAALAPKDTVSLVAADGANTEEQAQTWLEGQARRLRVRQSRIVKAIKNGWTLFEIEQTAVDEADKLARPVHEVKPGKGFAPGEEFNPFLSYGDYGDYGD